MTTFEAAATAAFCTLQLIDLDGRAVSDPQPITWVSEVAGMLTGVPVEFETATTVQPAAAVLADARGRRLDVAEYAFGVWMPGELITVTPRVRLRLTGDDYRDRPTQEGPPYE